MNKQRKLEIIQAARKIFEATKGWDRGYYTCFCLEKAETGKIRATELALEYEQFFSTECGYVGEELAGLIAGCDSNEEQRNLRATLLAMYEAYVEAEESDDE